MNSKRTADGGGGSNLNFDERGTLEGVVQMKYGRLHHISGKFRLRYAVLNMMDGSFAFYSIDHHSHSSSRRTANDGGANRATLSRNLVLLLPHGSWSMYGGPFDDEVGDGVNEGDGGDAATPYLEIVYSNCFQKRRRRKKKGRGGGHNDDDHDDGGAAFPTNVSPDRRDFGRRYRRGYRRISVRCASVAERGSWIDAAERVHARGGSSRSIIRGSGGDAGEGSGAEGVAVVATAAAAGDDPIAMRRRGVRKVRGLRLRRLRSRRGRTAAAQHLVGGCVVERSAARGHREMDVDDADEESNGNNRSSYSAFDGDGDDMDEEDEVDEDENADFFDEMIGLKGHPYGIIAPQHHLVGSNGDSESDGEDEGPRLGGAVIAPAPKIFRASSEPPIGTTFQSSLNNASSVSHGNDDDDGTAGVHSCRSSPGALYRGGSPRKGRNKMQRYKKVKPHHAYPATYMMEEEIVAEMMKPSDRYEDLCRYDYSSLQRISSAREEGRPSQIGRLQVEVLSCIGLPKFDRFSKTDTTVYLLCSESAFATDVIPSCLCPMWPRRSRRAVRIPLFHAYARLFVGVFGVNSNEKENDHFVGRAVIDLATLRPGTEYDATLGLGLSSYAYDRRPRGAVRLRFHLDWSDERAAVLSYLRRCPAVDGRGVAGVTIPCSDAKTFRNVAITLHGNNLPGKFSRRNFRATRREFVLYHIQTSALVKRIIRNIISWKDPRVSGYVFLGWMHCVYSSSVAMALSYLLGFLIILFVKNYIKFNLNGEACAHGYAPLTFMELFLSLLLGGSCSNRHYMKPASMMSDRTMTTASERTLSEGSETQDGEKLFMDPDSLDHMEFPFSERNLYPKRAVKEYLVPRVRSNTSDKLSSGQKRLLSATASSQLPSPLFDRNDSDLSDEDELSDGEDDSAVSDLQPEDEELLDDVSQLQTSTTSGTLIPAGPNQNVDIFPKKRVAPKVHLLKFENWIHNTTGRIFDEKVTCSTMSSRTKAACNISSAATTQGDDESPEHSDDKDVNLAPANPSVDVTLLGSGYLDHFMQAAPILVRQATRYLPMQAPILTSSLSSLIFNPTLRLYEDQKCRMISHSSTNSMAQPGNACPDGSASGKKSKRSIDEFDKRLGLHRQRPNPVAALSADYLGPIMRIMQIYSCAVRIVFNAFAWKDPFLSFWILIFLIAATTLSIIFPWRNFFFVVGLVGLGPQNLILLAVSKQRIEQQVVQQSTTKSSSDCVKDRRIDDSDVCGSSSRVGMKGSEPGQSCDDANALKRTSTFSRLARRRPTMLRRNKSETPSFNTNNGRGKESKLPPPFSGRPVKSAPKKGRKQASPREVIVPYTPLRKERFYYWPPDPSASGITVMTSGNFRVDN